MAIQSAVSIIGQLNLHVLFDGYDMQSHGSFEIYTKDQALIVKAIGAWNYETALSCAKAYKELVIQFNGKPWACLLDLTEWELFTPEASDCIDQLNEWGNEHNQKYEVVIFRSAIQKGVMEKSHRVLTNVETMFCESFEQAELWLKKLGVIS
ncbi:hypothetical protein [Aliiglaciecola lipolytica]|uniref:STAS/SEC14 domain-containing protein n=1 Tax=Aliiglaciecola lipolytica E3 TaxID=1127673 RepID=K6Y8C7_9ALTE|nr:hypothetical protein [Aliiglaciecola lipolytica]GAC12888.1 hypothetical protein GLIP_0234 [Aliiglaciecola lipolytica E3]